MKNADKPLQKVKASRELLVFDTIREDRGWYFVEYHPPTIDSLFAQLSLVIMEDHDLSEVALAMEKELVQWLKRYPLPLMISASDRHDSVIRLTGVRSSDHLIGYVDATSGDILSFWRLLRNAEFPSGPISKDRLLSIFSDVHYRTRADIDSDIKRGRRQLRLGLIVVFLWLVVLPAVWAVFELIGPRWVAFLVMVFALWKATVKALKLLGKWRESPREKRKREEDLKMRHYFYHCERNPEGFERLKAENFRRETELDIEKQAKELKMDGRKRGRSTDKNSHGRCLTSH